MREGKLLQGDPERESCPGFAARRPMMYDPDIELHQEYGCLNLSGQNSFVMTALHMQPMRGGQLAVDFQLRAPPCTAPLPEQKSTRLPPLSIFTTNLLNYFLIYRPRQIPHHAKKQRSNYLLLVMSPAAI